MSELNSTWHRTVRWELMTTSSALVFLALACDGGQARAAGEDADRPTVWIELGVQSEQVSGFGDPFAPPFTQEIIADGFTSPLKAQQALGQSFGGEGRVSFQPENSSWFFSASILYGRANGGKATHDQTAGGKRHVSFVTSSGILHTGSIAPNYGTVKASGLRVSNNATHAILDFQVGKDVGLGLFKGDGQSTLGFGVRFAQFTSKQVLGIIADPDFYFPLDIYHDAKYHHAYTVSSHIERSFRGLGPSASWNASLPLIGHADDGGLSLDWGANAALLFGRQNAQGQHQTVGGFYKNKLFRRYYSNHFQRSGNLDRSRAVLVPNLGAFAGASFLYYNAKVSFGYRADFFFGAMDGGVDTAQKENRGFFGPFASVSVGLGG